MSNDPLETRKTRARAWFESLRDDICAALEAVEAGLPRRRAVRGSYRGAVRSHALEP